MSETERFPAKGGRSRLTRQEREARNRAIVAASRRGVSTSRIAETHELTPQMVGRIVRSWADVPSIPRPGVRVDTGEEVARALRTYEQLIEDMAAIVGCEGSRDSDKLGAASRMIDLVGRRLQLQASAGYIAANLASPQVEVEMVRLVRTVVDVLREHEVPQAVIEELLVKARTNVRTPSLELEAVAA